MVINIQKINYYSQKALIFLLVICLTEQACAQSLKATAVSLVAGTALALGAHTFCEYSSTLGHELGHAIVNKLLTGDPVNINISPNPSLGAQIVQPFVGRAHLPSDTHALGEQLRTAAGPLAGLALTQAQLLGIVHFEKNSNKQKAPVTLQPFGFFKDLYYASKSATGKILNKRNYSSSTTNNTTIQEAQVSEQVQGLTTRDVALAVLKFLRCSRLVGEALYGFTPFTKQQCISDGQHLWSRALNRPFDNYSEINLNLLGLTSAIMATPALAGVGKAVFDKLQEYVQNK